MAGFQAAGEAGFPKMLRLPGAILFSPPLHRPAQCAILNRTVLLFSVLFEMVLLVSLLHLFCSLLNMSYGHTNTLSPISNTPSLYLAYHCSYFSPPLIAKLFKRIASDFSAFPTMVS